MDDVRLRLLSEIRERLVIARSMVDELAGLALRSPPQIASELERIVEIAHSCVTQNVEAIARLISEQPDARRVA